MITQGIEKKLTQLEAESKELKLKSVLAKKDLDNIETKILATRQEKLEMDLLNKKLKSIVESNLYQTLSKKDFESYIYNFENIVAENRLR